MVRGAVLSLVLLQHVADLFDPLQKHVVVFVHQTLDPAAGGTFMALGGGGLLLFVEHIFAQVRQRCWSSTWFSYPVVICAERPLLLGRTIV